MTARYDGHADWYDETFARLADPEGSAGLLARLVGEPPSPRAVCVDVGCGTGLHLSAVHDRGWHVVGVELSRDQLRIAATRHAPLLRADARRLPLADRSVQAVTSTYTHTDIDDFPSAVAEAARVLAPGGLLVHLGVHPAFVGAFVDRSSEVAEQTLRYRAGYGREERHVDPTGRLPVRSRVGARNLTLSTVLEAVTCQPRLHLRRVLELDAGLQPWHPGAPDGRVAPWNLALVAAARG